MYFVFLVCFFESLMMFKFNTTVGKSIANMFQGYRLKHIICSGATVNFLLSTKM